MKNFLLTLLLAFACALTAQTENIANEYTPGTAAYQQPAWELEALAMMAMTETGVHQDSLPESFTVGFRPFRDTVQVEYIVYADHDGIVRLAEDVELIRYQNTYQKHQRPIGVACRRVLMVQYYE